MPSKAYTKHRPLNAQCFHIGKVDMKKIQAALTFLSAKTIYNLLYKFLIVKNKIINEWNRICNTRYVKSFVLFG